MRNEKVGLPESAIPAIARNISDMKHEYYISMATIFCAIHFCTMGTGERRYQAA
jgi:hypothetical protein